MKKQIKKILKNVYQNNGGTFLIKNNKLKKFKKGFVAGIKETEEIFPVNNFYEKNIKTFLKRYSKDNKIIGFWIYKNNIHMNLCVISNDENKIKKFCEENNLIAYYDLKNKKNIFL